MKNISWKRWKPENVLEILKIEHQFNQISLTSAIIIGKFQVTDI